MSKADECFAIGEQRMGSSGPAPSMTRVAPAPAQGVSFTAVIALLMAAGCVLFAIYQTECNQALRREINSLQERVGKLEYRAR